MIQNRIAFIVVVVDYHDVEYMAHAIKGVALSYKELGMSDGEYVGVIFNHCSPGDNEIADLLLGADVVLEDRL